MNLRKRVPKQPVTKGNTKTCAKKKIVHEESLEESLEESEEEFEVEKILDKKTVGKRVKYFLKWKGYPISCNTWEDKSGLNCSQLIKEFERNLKKEKDIKQKADKENAIEKKKNTDVPAKNLRGSKKTRYAYYSSRRNSLDDFIAKDDSYWKHERIKDAELNEREIIKKRHCNGSQEKPTRTKNTELKKHEVIQKNHYSDSRAKHTVENAEPNEHQIVKKRHKDSGTKHIVGNVEPNEREIVKKRHKDSRTKHTVKNVEPNEQEIVKKRHKYLGTKYTVENVELNEREIVKKRHNDSRTKHTVKNVEPNEHETVKKRHNDYGMKHTIKNVEPNEQETIKKRRDGSGRKKPEVALSSSRNRKMPKIQNLQYYVKSTNFPKKRKNGMLSVMKVSFQGTDVLKGLERFVEAGIAVSPLPDYLYDKPIKTGATEFQLTV